MALDSRENLFQVFENIFNSPTSTLQPSPRTLCLFRFFGVHAAPGWRCLMDEISLHHKCITIEGKQNKLFSPITHLPRLGLLIHVFLNKICYMVEVCIVCSLMPMLSDYETVTLFINPSRFNLKIDVPLLGQIFQQNRRIAFFPINSNGIYSSICISASP